MKNINFNKNFWLFYLIYLSFLSLNNPVFAQDFFIKNNGNFFSNLDNKYSLISQNTPQELTVKKIEVKGNTNLTN
ncbi:hypothetical protein [Geminocystis sp. GBBB08]|uniref:hypothetical protein n=1 Tax=Geminocystis sp. GBBB08 TaxID=2604140 RepID=UPI0027E3ADD3|nr:hypothetical protein [Geminocystis sp. GBBB08]